MALAESVMVVIVTALLGLHAQETNNGRRVSHNVIFTHPETMLPVCTGLIGVAPEVNTTRRHGRPSARPGNGQGNGVDPCSQIDRLHFRTADGSCNHPMDLGQSVQLFGRLLPPAYHDGVQAPRQRSVSGGQLPSPRTVSRTVHPDVVDVTNFTIFLMQWGQFMDHEVVSTPLAVEDTRGVITCCGPNKGPPTGTENSECFPIRFPAGDPDFDGTCMEFVRSQPANDTDGSVISPRENVNLITSFVDASAVYGNTQERQDLLRQPGQLHLLRTTSDNFPPDNERNDCVKRNANDICFLAGDDRVNEQPGLTLIHTLFVRYHNHLALERVTFTPGRLHSPHHQEIVFQQIRAFVGAVMQNILYSEWLSMVLGPNVRAQYKLNLSPSARTPYNSSVDPRVFTAFSTAVFRFGHTLIPRSLPLTPTRRVALHSLFFTPFETRENLDTLLAGLVQAVHSEDRTQNVDRFIVNEVTGKLFENQEGSRRGFDLVALNLQRGRDHGIPSYNDFRAAVGLPRIVSFTDPALGTSGPALQAAYSHVDDIELFSGGMSEPSFDGGLVGETFSNLMALQFHRLKFGDKFFFNNNAGGTDWGFSNAQVALIRSVRLSHVLCLTSNLARVQRNVFRVASPSNPTVDCATLRLEHPSTGLFLGYPDL